MKPLLFLLGSLTLIALINPCLLQLFDIHEHMDATELRYYFSVDSRSKVPKYDLTSPVYAPQYRSFTHLSKKSSWVHPETLEFSLDIFDKKYEVLAVRNENLVGSQFKVNYHGKTHLDVKTYKPSEPLLRRHYLSSVTHRKRTSSNRDAPVNGAFSTSSEGLHGLFNVDRKTFRIRPVRPETVERLAVNFDKDLDEVDLHIVYEVGSTKIHKRVARDLSRRRYPPKFQRRLQFQVQPSPAASETTTIATEKVAVVPLVTVPVSVDPETTTTPALAVLLPVTKQAKHPRKIPKRTSTVGSTPQTTVVSVTLVTAAALLEPSPRIPHFPRFSGRKFSRFPSSRPKSVPFARGAPMFRSRPSQFQRVLPALMPIQITSTLKPVVIHYTQSEQGEPVLLRGRILRDQLKGKIIPTRRMPRFRTFPRSRLSNNLPLPRFPRPSVGPGQYPKIHEPGIIKKKTQGLRASMALGAIADYSTYSTMVKFGMADPDRQVFFILSFYNEVQIFFKEPSLTKSLDFTLSLQSLGFMKTEHNDLGADPFASQYLDNLCKGPYNLKIFDHVQALTMIGLFDISEVPKPVLLKSANQTRALFDVDTPRKRPDRLGFKPKKSNRRTVGPGKRITDSVGMALLGSTCDRNLHCTVIEMNSFAPSISAAHELAHSMGMNHEGVNGCPPDESPTSFLIPNSDMKNPWSQFAQLPILSGCAIRDLVNFVRGTGSCLLKPSLPVKSGLEFKKKLKDVLRHPFTAEDICKLRAGPMFNKTKQWNNPVITAETGNVPGLCQSLMCTGKDSKSPSDAVENWMFGPAPTGTQCRPNGQVCYNFQCVDKATIPSFYEDSDKKR